MLVRYHRRGDAARCGRYEHVADTRHTSELGGAVGIKPLDTFDGEDLGDDEVLVGE